MAVAVALARPLRRLPYSPCPRRVVPTPLRFFARGRCDVALAVAAAAVGDSSAKGSVHRHVTEEVMDILEMAQRASQRRDVFHTSFLTPPIIKEAMLAIEKLADIKAVAQGGYPQAERCRISVGHPDSMRCNPDVVAALSEMNYSMVCYIERDVFHSINDDDIVYRFQSYKSRRGILPRRFGIGSSSTTDEVMGGSDELNQ